MKIYKVSAMACGLVMAGAAVVASAALPVKADNEDVEISAENFPDETFCKYVKDNFDENDDNVLSEAEIAAVTSIDVKETLIDSMEGLKFFTALTDLNCSGNLFSELDISGLENLESLDCSNNASLQKIVSKGNAKLSKFLAKGTSLASVDVREYTALKALLTDEDTIEKNGTYKDKDGNIFMEVEPDILLVMEGVDLDKENFPDDDFREYVTDNYDTNRDYILDKDEGAVAEAVLCEGKLVTSLKGIEYLTGLKELDCSCMQGVLTELDLSCNTKLERLVCSGNKLRTLDLTKNTRLKELFCSENILTKIDLGENDRIKEIGCGSNKLTKIDFSGCPNLEILSCSWNKLTSFDATKYPNLVTLEIDGNRLSRIDVSKNTELVRLNCSDNQLKALNVRNNKKLVDLRCDMNQITKIDVSGLTDLNALVCSSSPLTSVNVKGCTKLEVLSCGMSYLTSLDVSTNENLKTLACDWTDTLVNLDLSKNKNLETLYLSLTGLDIVDVRNCEPLVAYLSDPDTYTVVDTGEMYYFNADGEMFMSVNEGAVVIYSDDFIAIDETNFPDEAFRKYIAEERDPNHDGFLTTNEIKELTGIVLEDTDVVSLKGIELFPELAVLICESNEGGKLESIDVSKNTKLAELYVRNNKIASIDLSNNTELQTLMISKNDLETLDISACAKLLERLASPTVEKTEEDDCIIYSDKEDVEHPDLLSYDKKTELKGIESPEKSASVGDFVERLYTEALGRASEEKGKQYWTEEITSGRWTGGDVGRYFLLGDEFTNRNLSIEDFVETLYKTFFGRESEANGKKFWVDSLKNGSMTREAVIDNFIDSKEWCNLCAEYGVKPGAKEAKAEKASKNATAFATRLYTCCLGRDPEEKGLSYWALALTNLEQTGCSAAKEFFTSKEFVNLNLKDEEYVKRLYTTFMDREPEANEVSYWAGEIGKGTQTRASVLAFFGSSEEFTAICKSYGIERGTI